MTKKTKITIFILLGVLGVLIIAAAILIFGGDIFGGQSLKEENEAIRTEAENLEAERARLEVELAELEAKVAELEANLSDSGQYFADEIEDLKTQIEEKNAAIATLEADIARYQTVYEIDVIAQARLIDKLVEYIETQSPYVLVSSAPAASDTDAASEDTQDADATTYTWVLVSELIEEERAARAALGEDAEPLFTPEELAASSMTEAELTNLKLREAVLAREDVMYPLVSVYYEDLSTGYHFGFAENTAHPTASVIKAPFILSALMKVSADEQAYFDKLEAEGKYPEKIDTDGDGTPDKTVIEYSDPKYDLSEVVVYDSATMFKEGSGKIREMPNGTEFTYIDFIKYALEYSDNIAYQQLKNRFGYTEYYALARSVGATVSAGNANYMSARDAGKLFKAIHEFIEEDETYGPLMRESMEKANHTVIIPHGVSPNNALHKYGWDIDSYHDAAIVEAGDKPYVLAVFSNLDMGGNEVNAYLREIVKMINQLHKGFYNN
ncbi:MAG: serine hydrolase [Clostridia bacterium]|nr:serine hydrolase [Clostridia bacterium]